MRCPTCYGGTPAAPCVCETQAELADTQDTGEIDPRFLLTQDVRDEHRHAEDFNPPAWIERHET
jgi:hypothetical protein